MTDTRPARERMRMARTAVQVGLDRAQLLDAWLDAVPHPTHLPGGAPARFGAGLAADCRELTLRATGDASGMLMAFSQLMAKFGMATVARDHMFAAFRALHPATAGSFLQARADGADLGWSLDGPFALDAALAWVPAGVPRDTFGQWAREAGIATAQGLGVFLASNMTRIGVPLPATGAAQWHRQLAAALGVRGLGDGAAEIVGRAEAMGKPVFLVAELGEPKDGASGVGTLGLVLPQPDSRTVVELLALAGVATDAQVATFEGFLGVDGAQAVVIGATGGVLMPVLQYMAGEDALA